MSKTLEQYDVVVIGSGPGGYVAAVRAAQLGLKTAIVEKDKALGGTCLYRGCIPTKALLENAHIYEQFQHGKDFGITAGEVSLNFEDVQKRKSKIVTKLAKGVQFLMGKNKIETIYGFGSLAGQGKVLVKGADGKTQTLSAKNVILATGSATKSLPHLALDHQRIIDSDDVLELKSIPKSMIVLGAGAVGVEFASIYARFGTEVTIVELLPHALPIEDEEISLELEKSFKKKGITVRTKSSVTSAKASGTGVEVEIKDGDGNLSTSTAELLLIAVGRKPMTEGIGLEQTRAVVEKGYVKVNGLMETAEPGLFAIGDIVQTPWLAHVASAEGILAAEKIADKEVRPINYNRVPSCTYCEPEVASMGLTERAAREQGYEVKTGKFPFGVLARAQILGVQEGFVKIVSEAKYGEILGVHMIGPRVTELIAEAGALLSLESTVHELGHIMHAHPTLAEAVAEAAHDVYKMAIHI